MGKQFSSVLTYIDTISPLRGSDLHGGRIFYNNASLSGLKNQYPVRFGLALLQKIYIPFEANPEGVK
jgi:hypothetical protein